MQPESRSHTNEERHAKDHGGTEAAALMLPARANAAVKPKTGTWNGDLSATEHVRLEVAKKAQSAW